MEATVHVHLTQDALKGLIPDADIDGWITMPSGASSPDAAHRSRVPIKHVSVGKDRVVARVHPDWHPGHSKANPTQAELKEHEESLKRLKDQEIVLEGDALAKHREIAGKVAENSTGLAKDVAEKRAAKLEPAVVPPAPEKHSAQSILSDIDAHRDSSGGHANEKDDVGWDGSDKGIGGHLASTPEEDWTPSDWERAKYLLKKYKKQHGISLADIEMPEGEGERGHKGVSIGKDGSVLFDYPYDEYLNSQVRGAFGARWNGGKRKIVGSVADLVRGLSREDPLGGLEDWAERHGFALSASVRDAVGKATEKQRATNEKVKARAEELFQESMAGKTEGQRKAFDDLSAKFPEVGESAREKFKEQARREVEKREEGEQAAKEGKKVFSTPWDDRKVGFGQHRDKTWKELAKTNPGYLEWMTTPSADFKGERLEAAKAVLDAHVKGIEPVVMKKEVVPPKAFTKELETPWDNVKIGGASKYADVTWGDLWKEKPRSIEFYATDPGMREKSPGMAEIASALLAAKRDGKESPLVKDWRERKEKRESAEADRAAAVNRMESAKRDTTVHMMPEFEGGLLDPKMKHVDPTTYERDSSGQPIPGTAKQAGVRPYQAQAVNFMAEAKRCSDFDEMGLGKTLSTINAALLLKHRGEVDGSAILHPPSLLKNWRDELQKFAPKARILEWAGTAAQRRAVYEKAKRDGFDFLLVPDSMIIQKEDGPLIGELCGGERVAKFVDEAHSLKGGSSAVKAKMTLMEATFLQNAPDSVMFRGEAAVPGMTSEVRKKMYREDKIHRQWTLTDTWRKFKAQIQSGGDDAMEELTSGVVKGKRFGAVRQFFNKGHFKLLTATPVPNDPREAYRLMQLVDPAVLGDRKTFEDRYLIRKSVGGHDRIVGSKNLEQLHEQLKPYFIMRKLRDPEVGIHLPPLVTEKPKLSIANEQRPYYRAAVADAIDAINSSPSDETATALERLAGADDTIDFDAEAARVDTSDKKQKKNILTALLRLRQVGISPELVDRNYTGPAPKIEAAAQAIRDHLKSNPGQGIAVFCEFNGAFPLLQRELMKEDEDGNAGLGEQHFGLITGDTPQKKRDKIQDGFNAGEVPVALINVRAGGLGLNLQKNSSAVIHLSSHWNPKVEDQATARVYRPGQQHKTLMMKPLMDDPMDAHIEDLHTRKRATEDAILLGKEKQLEESGDDQVRELRALLPRLKEFEKTL